MSKNIVETSHPSSTRERLFHGFRLGVAMAGAATFAAGVGACGGEESFVRNAECVNGAEQELPCGVLLLGVQTQRCERFQWEDFGVCSESLACLPGDTRGNACGFNLRGEQTQICGDNTWKNIDQCRDPDACTDGEELAEACGLNARGTQLLLCVKGQLELQDCNDFDVCVDGEFQGAGCPDDPELLTERICENGQWARQWAMCWEPTACDDGEVFLEDCGFEGLGVQKIVCTAGKEIAGECEMRGKHVFLQDTLMFLVDLEDTLWVSGVTDGTLAGRAVSNAEGVKLRQPFEEPVSIPEAGHFALSSNHACMIQEEDVFCWGSNSQGQLGVPTSLTNSRTPVRVPNVGGGDNPAVQVVVTSNVSCARMQDGDVRCWGWNGDGGGVGAGKQGEVRAPIQPKGFLNAIPPTEQLFAREQIVCARTLGSDIYCWGDNTRTNALLSASCVLPGFSCGTLSRPTMLEPTKITAFTRTGEQVLGLHVYRNNGCAFYADGAVICWGENKNGEVGNGGGSGSQNPAQAIAPGNLSALSLHTDAHRRCARMKDGSLRCWGRQVLGDTNARMIPSQGATVNSPLVSTRFVASGSLLRALSIADTGACAVQTDDVVRCTGVSSTGSFARDVRPVSQGDAKPVLCPAE